MAYHFNPETLTVDHAAIHADAAYAARINAARFGTSEDAEFEAARTRYIERAQGTIADRLWIRERNAAVAAMSDRDRQVHTLREAAHLAPMIDDSKRAHAEQAAAEHKLAALMAEPV